MRIRVGKLRLALLTLLVLTAVACGSAPRTFYHTIGPLSSPADPAGSTTGQLGVAKPQASHLLRQDRIVYFTDKNELNFYQYHRWAEPPPIMVQSLLVHRLRSAGLFGDVVVYRAQPGLDYILRSQLLAMEEVDAGSEIMGRFELAAELVRQEDNVAVWSGQHRCERAVAEKTVTAVVTTINACVDETLAGLTRSLGQALREIEPKPATDAGGTQ